MRDTRNGRTEAMRVVHVLESFGAGVFETMRALVVRQAADQRCEVHVIYSAQRAEVPAAWETLFPASVTFHSLSMEREIRPVQDAMSVVRLIRLLRRLSPSVVHLHSSKAGALGRIACLCVRNVAVVYTPHGLSFLRQDISRSKAMVMKGIEWMLARTTGVVVAVSASERAELRGVVPAARLRLVENGVDHDALARRSRPEARVRGATVGMAGRLTMQKGPRLFAEVASLVIAARPETQFVWIGDGPDRAILEMPALAGNISVTGWVTRDEALKRIAAVDVYLHTSLWEGLPITILEAMALGRPVVATNAVGNRDVVIDGVTGYLGDTPAKLASAVVCLLDHPEVGARLARAASEHVALHHNLDRMAALYRSLYDEVQRCA